MLTLPLFLILWPMPASQLPDSLVLVDFSRPTSADWYVVNDGVMGGVSSSNMEVTGDGTGVFAGRLSLENNGGFASVRTVVAEDLADLAGLVLQVRGDGRTYQLRLRTTNRFDGIAYRAEFGTRAGEWITVVLPFNEFVPTFRGYTPPNAPPLEPSAVRQLGFLIGDKREGAFHLEVKRILAVRNLPRDR